MQPRWTACRVLLVDDDRQRLGSLRHAGRAALAGAEDLERGRRGASLGAHAHPVIGREDYRYGGWIGHSGVAASGTSSDFSANQSIFRVTNIAAQSSAKSSPEPSSSVYSSARSSTKSMP